MLALALLMLAPGALLLLLGLLGRHDTSRLVCAACRFSLDGLPQTTPCPECSKSVRKHPRRRSRKLLTLGVLASGVGLVPCTLLSAYTFLRAQPTSSLPNWLIRRDLTSSHASRVIAASSEAESRIQSGRWNKTDTVRALDALIRANSWQSGWAPLVRAAREKDFASDATLTTFVSHATQLSTNPHYTAFEGELALLFIKTEHIPSTSGFLCSSLGADLITKLVRATADGRDLPIAPHKPDADAFSFASSFVPAPSVAVGPLDAMPTGPLRLTMRCTVYRHESDVILGTFYRTLHSSLRVITKQEIEQYPTWESDSLPETLINTIGSRAHQVNTRQRSSPGYSTYEITLAVENAPANLAFNIFIRNSQAAQPQEGPLHFIGTWTTLPQPIRLQRIALRQTLPRLAGPTIDIVFRPSRELALTTPALTSCWIGPDIIIPAVPVEQTSP